MELVDVYDEQHILIRSGVPRGTMLDFAGGERYLVCHVCIFSPDGRMLVQKRQATKEVYPGYYDISAGGFVRSGETSRKAVLREAGEEIGVYPDPEKVFFLDTIPAYGILDDFYMMLSADDRLPENLQEEEVSMVAWMTCEEILRKIGRGEFVDYPPDLIRRVFRAASAECVKGGCGLPEKG